jgi:fimbrial isopeptide formation D2 family protein/uncharacterized repeat protein (TIGR02543 family)
VSLTVTFTINSVSAGVTNTAEVKVNGVSIGTDPEVTYVVSYDANYPVGSTGQDGSVPVSGLYVKGSTVTVVGNTGGLAVDGYVFIGWNTAATGSGDTYIENNKFTITKDTVLYALWVPSAGLTKEFSDNSVGPYGVGDSVKYMISYTIPNNAWSLTSFEIIDTYNPDSGLTYDSAIVKINGATPSSPAIITPNTGQVTFTFTPSSLTVGAKVEIEITFKVVKVTDGGASNTASININGNSIDDDTATLYSVVYLPGATSVTGNVPADKMFYETGKTVTVLGNIGELKLDGHSFIGWLYNGEIYNANDAIIISEDVELVAQDRKSVV